MTQLLFGQQNAYTAPWLAARLGQSVTVHVEDFPHVAALRGDHAAYLGYLAESWRMHPLWNTVARRKEQLDRLLRWEPTADQEPIEVITRPDGGVLIADGNHRAAVDYARGLPSSCKEMALGPWFRRTTRNDSERYGTGLRGIPYQSVYSGDQPIIVGRRTDTLSRHRLLLPDDIAGRRVLDLGCNIGGASFLAARTAGEVLGVDSSSLITTAAVRLGTYLTSPVRFRVADLKTKSLEGWDTVLCFAVLAHIKDLRAIRRTLASARVVYVEENIGLATFPAVRRLFRHIERIPGGVRQLWRCET